MSAAQTLFDDEPHSVDPDPVLAAVPGGPVLDATRGPWGLATASFSSDLQFRLRLSRVWDPALGRVNFLMLNPSTADAFQLDPTVRRCVGFAQGWGYGALEVTNAFALRSTDPRGLYEHPAPVGSGNDEAIVAAAAAADVVVAAWGVHARLGGREQQVRTLLADAGVRVHYLRLTKDGHPGHPLYLRGDSVPIPWV